MIAIDAIFFKCKWWNSSTVNNLEFEQNALLWATDLETCP